MAGKLDDDRISLAPFIFSPAEFALDGSESVDLNIILSQKMKKEVTKNSHGMRQLSSESFTISGTGCRVDAL